MGAVVSEEGYAVNLPGVSRPATRLLTMLELLQARGRVSGRALAERLEVDPRTVRRYAAKLSELGIPVEAERGPYGGYRLRAGYKLPPLMLTDAEATAVVLGLIAARQTGIATRERGVEEALAKILRVLPTELRDRVGALQDSLGTMWQAREPQPPATEVVLTLAQSIRAKRRVGIRYATGGREERERTVVPYGLVFHAGRWYLAAHDDRTDEVRAFRVDRVRQAEARPSGLSCPRALTPRTTSPARSAQAPWGWEIEVVLETTLQEARRRIPRTIGDPEQIDGGVLLRAQSDDLAAAARELARLGWPFTVRRPPELRAAVRKLAATLEAAARPSE